MHSGVHIMPQSCIQEVHMSHSHAFMQFTIHSKSCIQGSSQDIPIHAFGHRIFPVMHYGSSHAIHSHAFMQFTRYSRHFTRHFPIHAFRQFKRHSQSCNPDVSQDIHISSHVFRKFTSHSQSCISGISQDISSHAFKHCTRHFFPFMHPGSF
jgi:hypothetical protein